MNDKGLETTHGPDDFHIDALKEHKSQRTKTGGIIYLL